MKIRFSWLALVIVLSLQATGEEIGAGHKIVALWHLADKKRENFSSSVRIRRFKKLGFCDITMTVKLYDMSDRLFKVTTQRYCKKNTSKKPCSTQKTIHLQDEWIDCNSEDDLQESTEQIDQAFKLVDCGDYAGIKTLLSQYQIPVNYQSSEGETLLMRAVKNIKSDHWVDMVKLILEHGARSDVTDTALNTVFDAPSLRPDTIAAMFPDDRCSQKFAAADDILQMLIDQANQEYDN